MSKIISINTVLTKEQEKELQDKYGLVETYSMFLTLEVSPTLKIENVPVASERVLEKVLSEFQGKSKGFYDSSIVVANSQDLVVLFYIVKTLQKFGIKVLSKDLKEFI